MKQILTAIGLMSGTSLDGIDAAIIKTDGEEIFELGQTLYLEYDSVFRNKLRNYIEEIQNQKDLQNISNNQKLKNLEEELTFLHAQIVHKLLNKECQNSTDIDIIGFHGQTILHNPEKKFTLQIGNGKLLANLVQIDVICNFRQNDIEEGGQGAPLVPLYHYALTTNIQKPLAVLNIGGVANITYIKENKKNEILAFDIGPGCALIDDFILKNFNLSFDEDGKIARSGKINNDLLNKILSDVFFDLKPPKSLDRNYFSKLVLKPDTLSKEDYLATLTAFTAYSVVKSIQHLPCKPQQWLISGGGRKNKYLLELIESLTGAQFQAIDVIADGNMVEAQAFAFLAVRSKYNMYLTLPSTTGVSRPLTGGVFYPACVF